MTYHIQYGVQLSKKKWSGSPNCKSCGSLNLISHPLSVPHCILRMNLHCVLGWPQSPSSFVTLLVDVLGSLKGVQRSVTFFVCAGALWTLWKTRNDVVFNGRVVLAASDNNHS